MKNTTCGVTFPPSFSKWLPSKIIIMYWRSEANRVVYTSTCGEFKSCVWSRHANFLARKLQITLVSHLYAHTRARRRRARKRNIALWLLRSPYKMSLKSQSDLRRLHRRCRRRLSDIEMIIIIVVRVRISRRSGGISYCFRRHRAAEVFVTNSWE